MAAYFYTNAGRDVFKIKPIQTNVHIGFLDQYMGGTGLLIISEVLFQNQDTIQYFLTFDDLITYFYFGKGLGSLTITGTVLADCDNNGNLNWNTLNSFMTLLGTKRGTVIGDTSVNASDYLIMGGISLEGVLSTFTARASADINSRNCVDFTLQLNIINSSFPTPTINPAC